MAKTFLQSQQILKRCFNDVTGKLKARGGTYTMQDYLNAVYDEKTDSLRVALSDYTGGGSVNVDTYWGQLITNANQLPQKQEEGTLTPVINGNVLQFYYYQNNSWIKVLSQTFSLNQQQQDFIQWGIQNRQQLQFYINHKQQIEDLLKSQFAVKTLILQLPKPTQDLSGNISVVNIDVNGNIKNIVDINNEDGDIATHYKIDIDGYVIGLQTYQNSHTALSDKYYTKQVYEKDLGQYGVTHIYMTLQQYEYFSSLQNGKNVLKVNYLESMFGNNFVIKVTQSYLPGDMQQLLILDDNNVPRNISEGQTPTHYRYRIVGYVTSVQSYASDQHVQSDQVMPYIVDYNQGQNNTIGYTDVYFTKQAYDQIANLTYPKNVLKFYFLYQKK